MPRRERAYLADILLQAEEAVSYVENRTLSDFVDDHGLQKMVVRSLEVMGEAAKRLPAGFKQLHPHVPWRQMTGLRDVLVHEYDRLDSGEIWKVVTEDVHTLIPVLRDLVAGLDSDE